MIKTRMLAQCVVTLALACVYPAYAQSVIANPPPMPNPIKPFKSLCVPSISAGLNWVNGAWQSARFKPDRKIIVQKLDISNVESKPFTERPMSCKPSVAKLMDGDYWTNGCYLITELGDSPFPLMAEDCAEVRKNGVLTLIRCPRIGFVPNGNYIELPGNTDIEANPKNGYKDSIAVSAGQCSQVID